MANTTNLNLAKPSMDDDALITDINGNMDLIDAFAGSTNEAIANVNDKLFKTLDSTTDLNTVTTSGIYLIGSTTGTTYHRPTTSAGLLIVHRINDTARTQTYISYESSPAPVIYTRVNTNEWYSDTMPSERFAIASQATYTKALPANTVYQIVTSSNVATAMSYAFATASAITVETVVSHAGMVITTSGLNLSIKNNTSYSYGVTIRKVF